MEKWKEKQCKCGNWFETTRDRTKCIVCRIKDGRKCGIKEKYHEHG
jgi:hypothetical protein